MKCEVNVNLVDGDSCGRDGNICPCTDQMGRFQLVMANKPAVARYLGT